MSEPGYITTCAILHDIAIRNGQELDIPEEDEYFNRYGEEQVAEENEGNEGPQNQQLVRGLQARERIVRNYFHRE